MNHIFDPGWNRPKTPDLLRKMTNRTLLRTPRGEGRQEQTILDKLAKLPAYSKLGKSKKIASELFDRASGTANSMENDPRITIA